MHRDRHEIWAEILLLLNWTGINSTKIIYSCNLNSILWKFYYFPVLNGLGLIEQGEKGFIITRKGKRWLEAWENLRAIERESL